MGESRGKSQPLSSDPKTVKDIENLLGTLTRDHPEPQQLTHGLSDAELLQVISQLGDSLSQNVPIWAPEELAARVQEMVPSKRWRAVIQNLKQWDYLCSELGDLPLSDSEWDQLGLTLLWETLLINEYKRRELM